MRAVWKPVAGLIARRGGNLRLTDLAAAVLFAGYGVGQPVHPQSLIL
jgi:hypothetical protein